MNRYAIRAAKYVVYLFVLFLLIFAVMSALGGTSLSLSTLVSSDRGWWLAVVLVVFAAAYPFFGFTSKLLTVDAEAKADEVERVMGLCGYMRTTDRGVQEGVQTYRASSGVKRLALMYEDTITITTQNGVSTMAGPRKEVVRAAFRMTTFVQ